MTYYLRHVGTLAQGPKGQIPAGHPAIGQTCPACHRPIKPGDATTLIVLGPGPDPDDQLRARNGLVYNAVAVLVHWPCATGEPNT